MKKNLIVKQVGYKECGAASLLSIIHYYQGNISMTKLVELTNTTKDGTTLYDIKKAAEEIGLEAIGYKVNDITSLKEIKKPFICQLVNHNYEHFVVVYEIKRNNIIIMDPAVGEKKLTKEEFKRQWTSYIMIFSKQKELIHEKEEKYLNIIIKNTLKNNKRIVFDIQLLSIIFMIMSFISTLYFEQVIEKALDKNINILLIITFIFSCLILMKSITNFIRNELLIYLNQKIDCSILLNTFQKLLLLPYNYYKNKTTGEIITRINDLINIKNILNKLILTVCLDGIILISFSVILLTKNKILFTILVIIILIYLILFYLFRPKLKQYTKIYQNNSAKISSTLIETISGFETIKNLNLESISYERIENIYIKALHDDFNYNNILNLEDFMKNIISSIGVLLIQLIGFTMIIKGKTTLSNLITFTFLTNYILDSMKNILDLNKEYYYVNNSIKRANNLFEIENENLEKKTNIKLKGNIEFHNLSFGYREEDILKNINIKIKEKERVMILGNSGSGKSTLIKLLQKYYKIKRDSIYVNEIDLNDLTISDIRNEIACLSQNEFLLNDTIKNNIMIGATKTKIKEEEFYNVVKITQVDEFVKDLFLGYETKLEENGLNLSGGQRQRIMLARLLLKPSNIVIIDEGLNAVDVNLERKILKNIFKIYKNKTFIIVSHRIENLDLFNHVIKLNNGKLTEDINYPKGEVYD